MTLIKKTIFGENILNKKTAVRLFSQVVEILNKNKVKYWLDYSTLLGAVRDHDFITNASDITISLFCDRDSMVGLMGALDELRQTKGIAFTENIFQISKDNGYLQKASILVNDLDDGGYAKLELVPIYRVEGTYYKLTKYEEGRLYGAGIPQRFLQSFITVLFKDNFCYIPELAEELLVYYYGDWETSKLDITKIYKESFTLIDLNKANFSRILLADAGGKK